MILLQDNNQIKWKLGKSSLFYEAQLIFTCYLCKELFHSYQTKIFHNIDGCKFIQYKDNKKIYITHIHICFNCKSDIPKGWFPCRCKKK